MVFSVDTLNGQYWPCKIQEACVIPQEMKDISSKFELYYQHRHTGRNLNWLMHLGSAKVKPLFITDKPYIFTMTSYQSAIVLLFNTH